MNRSIALLLGASLGAVACQEEPIAVPLRSLAQSGDVAFVCVATADDTGNPGRTMEDCVGFLDEDKRVHALVTQERTGEIAIVDLGFGTVVDFDPSTPGFNFLPVGATPRDIVSTPGGAATFVGDATAGREGIYALPTKCIRPPARDLTSWPACSLPSPPGDLFVLMDRAKDGSGAYRASCDAPAPVEPEPIEHECRADLSFESAYGRHKIAAVMPSEGKIAIIDAQRLLDRVPGSFDACPVERWVDLRADFPASLPRQVAPPDLVAPGCDPTPQNHGPPETPVVFPAGGHLDGNRLYLADRGAPVVHVLDVSDPCSVVEQPPLLPASWADPGRTVTTRDVAVSPLTTDQKRFAYAIDETDGSVMVFDVSEGSGERTPIVRPRAPRLPFEAPDRIAFSSPAVDLDFVRRDLPIVDPTTGVALIGEACEPDPRVASPDAPAAKHRPSSDLSRGARPGQLRGVFGLVLLRSGQLAFIDVDDYDAPCRRPLEPSVPGLSGEDYRGCTDTDAPSYFTDDQTVEGSPTVTGEVSCQTVQRHRTRSATFTLTSSATGVRAPGLRSMPRLKYNGATLATDQTTDGRANPKMLAVHNGTDLPRSAARLFVGTKLLLADGDSEQTLRVSPIDAEDSSVSLVWNEPRAFAAEEDFAATYEGEVVGQRSAGIVTLRTTDPRLEGLLDSGASFCGRGVQDLEATKRVGRDLGVPSNRLNVFARRHADYVQITQPLLSEKDSYWRGGVGASCGGARNPSESFLACRTEFGNTEAPTDSRDWLVTEAYQDQLVLEPRRALATAADRDRLIDLHECCFPTAVSYRVRVGHQWAVTGSAGGFRHDIVADATAGPRGKKRCIHDCNPIKQFLNSRAYEVSCAGDCGASSTDAGLPAVGGPVPEEIVLPEAGSTPARGICTITSPDELLSNPGHPCIFSNLTHRFAIYRGSKKPEQPGQPVVPRRSERDMSFVWQVVGGFRPLAANLAGRTADVSPQSMMFVPTLGRVAIVDARSEGLALLRLDSISVSAVFF